VRPLLSPNHPRSRLNRPPCMVSRKRHCECSLNTCLSPEPPPCCSFRRRRCECSRNSTRCSWQ
jgi:hypothetical protein